MWDFLAVFVLSMLPVIETRLAIPYGIAAGSLPAWAAVVAGFAGSLVAVLLVLPALYRFGGGIASHSRFFSAILQQSRKRHASRFEYALDTGLVTLVALPLPFSGVWTGMLAAFAFGVPLRRALMLIAFGSFIGSIAIGLLVTGAIGAANLFESANQGW